MARICIYCGKELPSGEKCSCRGSSADTSAGNRKSSGSTSTDKKTKRKAKQPKADRQTTGRSGYRETFVRLLTSRGFNQTDSFPAKAGISLFHSFLRPVTAAEAFVRNNDIAVSVLYAVIFVLSFSVGLMRIGQTSLGAFGEGLLFGAAAFLLVNALTMLTFRFLLKARIGFKRFLAAFSLPSFYMSLFILIASAGRVTQISFFMTIAAGLAAMVLTHFISLKAMSGQPTERLLVNMILVYFIFLMITGVTAGLAVA